MDQIKAIFSRGLQATLPILLTVAILVWLVDSIELFFGFVIKLVIPPGYYIPGMGAVFGLLLIFTMGVVMNALMITKIYEIIEGWIKRIPVVKFIYSSIQDMMGFLDQGGADKKGKTVLAELPGFGRVLGFVTREDFSDLHIDSEDEVCVYFPMSYQIGGFTLFMPRKALKEVNLSAQEAMSFILTAGIASKKGDSNGAESQ